MSWWNVLAGVAAGVVVTAGVVAVISASGQAAPAPQLPKPEPTPPAKLPAGDEATAKLSIRAMIQAAKCDGRIDEVEMQRVLLKSADLTAEQRTFLSAEITRPFDAQGLIGATPRGSEEQVYLASAAAIDPDSPAETDYLHQLAAAFGLSGAVCDAIHQRLGQPPLPARLG